MILAGLVGCAAYGWVLIDWLQDMKTNNYESDPLEVVCEIVVILAYCYLAYRFIDRNVKWNIRLQNHPATSVATEDGQLQNRHTPWVKKDTGVPNVLHWVLDKSNPAQSDRS